MDKFCEGSRVIVYPYVTKDIYIVGFVTRVGRGIFNKREYIIVKGMKKNSYDDIFYHKIKIWDYDFNKVKFLDEK